MTLSAGDLIRVSVSEVANLHQFMGANGHPPFAEGHLPADADAAFWRQIESQWRRDLVMPAIPSDESNRDGRFAGSALWPSRRQIRL